MSYATNKRSVIYSFLLVCAFFYKLSANPTEVEEKTALVAEAQTKYDEAVALSKDLAEKAIAKRKEANDVAAATSLAGPTPDRRTSYQTELTEAQQRLEDIQEEKITLETDLPDIRKRYEEEKDNLKKKAFREALETAEKKITEVIEEIDELQTKITELNTLVNTPSPIEKTTHLSEEATQAEKAAAEAASKIEPLKIALDATQKELTVAQAKNEQEQKEVQESAEVLKKADSRRE